MIVLILIGLLLLLFMTGLPIAFGIGLTSMAAMQAHLGQVNFAVMAYRIFYGLNNHLLLAIPTFMLAGRLMNTGGVTRRLFRFANSIVGFLPGGLGHVNVVSSMLFAGMSGSATADTAGLGTIEIEAMTSHGYDRDFSAAVTGASSSIGPIIPPSIGMVIYGALSGTSILGLFLAGIIPGFIMGITLMVFIWMISLVRKFPRSERFSFKEFFDSFRQAILPLFAPFIIVGGIYFGVFTATEAAAVAVVYSLFLGFVVYRELRIKDLSRIILAVMKDAAAVGIVLAASSIYGWVLMHTRMPIIVVENLMQLTQDPTVIMVILMAMMLVLGMFLAAIPAITILVPILIPLATTLQIDTIQLGVLMVLTLTVGLLTPPVGVNLYMLHKVSGLSVDRLSVVLLPWLLPLIFVCILIAVFPQIVLFVPDLLMPGR